MKAAKATPALSEQAPGPEPEGVDHDDRLIRWMLEHTPAQRLEALQNFADGVVALQNARKIA